MSVHGTGGHASSGDAGRCVPKSGQRCAHWQGPRRWRTVQASYCVGAGHEPQPRSSWQRSVEHAVGQWQGGETSAPRCLARRCATLSPGAPVHRRATRHGEYEEARSAHSDVGFGRDLAPRTSSEPSASASSRAWGRGQHHSVSKSKLGARPVRGEKMRTTLAPAFGRLPVDPPPPIDPSPGAQKEFASEPTRQSSVRVVQIWPNRGRCWAKLGRTLSNFRN